MDAIFSMSLFAPLVLILLSISYCSVSATPVPQQYGGNYRGDPSSSFYSGFNAGSGQAGSQNNQFGYNNGPEPSSFAERNGIRTGTEAPNGNNDGLLTIIMLRIPPSLANAGRIIFSLQPHPTFEFGNNQPGNALSYNNYDNCQGGVCSYPPIAPPFSGGPSNGEFGTSGGSFGGSSGGEGGGGSFSPGQQSSGGGGFSGGFGAPARCPSGESVASHSGRCTKSA